jgi:hypothetical protein
MPLTPQEEEELRSLKEIQDNYPNLNDQEAAELIDLKNQEAAERLSPGLAKSVVTSQEEPPGLSGWDRFRIKAFGRDPQKALDELRESHPDQRVQYDPDADNFTFTDLQSGKITVLDPQTGVDFNSTEGAQKTPAAGRGAVMPEVVKDIAEGLPEAAIYAASLFPFGGTEAALGLKAASKIPALQGALAKLVTGGLKKGIPKAVTAAGAGARAAAAETAVQTAGMATGVNEIGNYDLEDIKRSGLTGAALTALLGGSMSKQAIQQLSSKTGMAQTAIESSQRGAASSVARRLYGTLIGVNPETTRNAIQMYDKLKSVEGPGKTLEYAESMGSRLSQALDDGEKRIGSALEELINSTKTPVDLSAAKKPVQEYIAGLKSEYQKYPTDILKGEIDRAETIYQNAFGATAEAVAPTPAGKLLSEKGVPFVQAEPAAPSKWIEGKNVVDAKTAFALQKLMKDPANLLKTSGTKAGIADVEKGAGIVSKRLHAKFSESYGAINDAIERATTEAISSADKSGAATIAGLSSKKLKDAYRDFKNVREIAAKHFDDPAKAYATITNLNKGDKNILFDQMRRIDDLAGTSLKEDAQFLDVFTTYGKSQLGFLPTKPAAWDLVRQKAAAPSLAAGGTFALTGNPLLSLLAGGAAAGATGKTARRAYLDLYKGLEPTVGPAMQKGKLPLWNLMMPKLNTERERQR